MFSKGLGLRVSLDYIRYIFRIHCVVMEFSDRCKIVSQISSPINIALAMYTFIDILSFKFAEIAARYAQISTIIRDTIYI